MTSASTVLGNLEPNHFYIHGIDISVFRHLNFLSRRHRTSNTRFEVTAETEVPSHHVFQRHDNVIYSRPTHEIAINISSPFIMDNVMLFLSDKLKTYQNNMLMESLRKVPQLAIETILKFIMRKIAAVTESQSVKSLKNTTCFFKRKSLRKHICTHVV